MKAIEVAFTYYGMRELPGEKHNYEILAMFKEIGHPEIKTDETAWCACFVNYCLKMAGLAYTGKLNARSFLEYGTPTDVASFGDIVVLWRKSPESWMGHVGFYVNEDEQNIYVLGGNQNNQVNITPYNKARLLGYRKVK